MSSSSESERGDERGAQASQADLLKIQRMMEGPQREFERLILQVASNALCWSAQAGNLSQCKSFLSQGANVNHVENLNNYTPLHLASLNGRTLVVELLIDHRADIEAKARIGFTPLLMAASEGHLATARLLVTRGARPDAANEQGVMPIHMAALANRHQVLEFLVTEAGVSVDVVSKYSIKPI